MPFTASDCQRARLQFPALARRQGELPIAYLDGPAGSQVPTPVIDAIAGYYREANANTHGQFATSQRSDELLQSRAREGGLLPRCRGLADDLLRRQHDDAHLRVGPRRGAAPARPATRSSSPSSTTRPIAVPGWGSPNAAW